MNQVRHIVKNVEGFLYKSELKGKFVLVEYRGCGIFDTKNNCFVCIDTINSGKPYTPSGGAGTAKKIAELINRRELLGKPHKVPHFTRK